MKIFKCSFCGEEIRAGTGLTYFKVDGSALHFCSSKCRKNLMVMKRKARNFKWTKYYPRAVKEVAGKPEEVKSKKESKQKVGKKASQPS